MTHIPVLLNEIITYLDPKPNQNFIDATLGSAGHARAILETIKPKGKLLALDRDPAILEQAKAGLGKYQNWVIAKANFKDIDAVALKAKFKDVSAVLFDLGLSSVQLDDLSRGFSFTENGPLDMRFDPTQSLTAASFIRQSSPKELVRIFENYGDIRRSWPLSKRLKLAAQRKQLNTTQDLVKAIGTRNPKILAPIFQAIRIAVNDEFNNLKAGLDKAFQILKTGGRLAVISFHSGEDRIAKEFFKNNPCLKIITKKPITPTEEEIQRNPRSRSAKLRIGEKIC